MLRLFSSIRKSLIQGNNTVKYLKYAVGEVLLIMVGIILALQFQTWNEGRKLALERQELIENLIEDFRFNMTVLENSIQIVTSQLEGLEAFLMVAAGEQNGNEYSKDERTSMAAQLFQGHRYNPKTGNYQAALSSGKINLLRDESLLELFHQFDRSHRIFMQYWEIELTDIFTGSI